MASVCARAVFPIPWILVLPVPPTSAIRPFSLAPLSNPLPWILALPVPPTSAIRPSSLAPLSNPPPWILVLPVPPTSAIRPSLLAPLSKTPSWILALPVPPTSASRTSSPAVPPTSAIHPSSPAQLFNPLSAFFPTARANPADHCHGLSRSPVSPSACSGANTATRNMHGFFLLRKSYVKKLLRHPLLVS